MMVSFMRCCKKISLFFALMLVCTQVLAVSSNIEIRAVELKAVGETYRLDADLEISLDEDIEEAVNKGVELNFLYEFQLVNPRSFWFDNEIVTITKNIKVSYHALSRQYLVSDDGRQTSHDILSEAMIELMQIEDWKVVEKNLIELGEQYKAALLVRLDQGKLSKAIQVDAIGSEDWNLISEKFEWLPKELNK
jgi:hypothetical protein